MPLKTSGIFIGAGICALRIYRKKIDGGVPVLAGKMGVIIIW